jgi:hypothetical protein
MKFKKWFLICIPNYKSFASAINSTTSITLIDFYFFIFVIFQLIFPV